MPREEIPSFIQRVAHDLTHKRPHVPENDTPWNESGVVESAYASSSMNEPYFHNSEAWEGIMKQSGRPQPSRNVEEGSYTIRGVKIHKLFQKMVEKGVLSPKAKTNTTPYMENHPKYCPFHCLMGHALEDCRGFRSWLHKATKSGLINSVEEYFELSSTCYALTVKTKMIMGATAKMRKKSLA